MSRYERWLREAVYRAAIEDNVVPPQGVYTRPAVRPAAFYEPFGVQFVWDLPYSGIAVLRVGRRPDLVRGFVENMVDFAVTDGPDAGMLPRSVTVKGDQAGQDGSQAPLLAWLTRELHRDAPDTGFLRRVYPGLARFADWWQSPRRDVDGDGLSEYAGSTPTYVAYESGHDYSPERDLVMGEPTRPSADGLVHEPIADVFLNSCLVVELDALAELAADVDPPRAAEWAERRDRLAARMHEAMWDEQAGGFFPVVRRDLCAAQPRVHRITPALLQPLWAGIATPEQAEATIATVAGRTRDYPFTEGVLSVRVDPDLYQGYQVVTDALHPSRGSGPAAGGVELRGDGLTLRFGADRGPAAAAFTRVEVALDVRDVAPGARLTATVTDGSGARHACVEVQPREAGTFAGLLGNDPFRPVESLAWTPGLREIDVRAQGCRVRELRVSYTRTDRAGLLSPYGVKSAHPLDGKHPAPGAPTEFWSGTIWGPHQLHACEAFERHGRIDLARAVARAYCDTIASAYAAGGSVFEHNSHEDGRGLGVPGYTWGGGVALVLMQKYLDTAE